MMRRLIGILLAVMAVTSASALTGGKRVLLGAGNGIPSWVLPGALIDLNLATGQYYGATLAQSLSNSNSTGGYVTTAAGTLSLVAPNTMRFGALGPVIEPSAQNKQTFTQNAFSGANWTKNNTTATDGTVTAPDGTLTASTVADNSTSGTHYIQEAALPSYTLGTTYVRSIYAQAGTGHLLQLTWSSGSFANNGYANFDLNAGTIAFSAGRLTAAGIQPLANGWYRCWISAVATANTTSAAPNIMIPTATSTRSPTYSGTGLTINIWGTQVELGSAPSSYWPSVASPQTRSADNVTISGPLATALGASSGTVSVQTNGAAQNVAATLIDANGTVLLGATATNLATTAVGANLSTTIAGNWAQANTATLSWTVAGGTIQLDGGTPSSDATARTPSGTFHLGSTSGSSAFINAYVSRITVYKIPQTLVASSAPAFRSFASITQYVSNPIVPFNAGSYNSFAADSPYINTAQNISGTSYALTQGSVSAGTTGWININMYTTTDYQSFTPYASNPVITATASTWKDHYLSHPAIIKIGSTWYAYYSGMNSAGTLENIGVATSTDFKNWTDSGSNPLITDNVGVPTIIQIGGTLYLYAADRPSGHTISYYTTSAVTPLGPWVRGGVALGTLSNDWDIANTRLNDPYVTINPQGFYEMMYTAEFFSAGTQYTNQVIGYATSPDGINWKKYQSPILQGDGVTNSPNQDYPGDALLFFNGVSVWMYFACVNSSVVAQGCLAKIVP